MDDRTLRLRVGVVVLVAALITGVLVMRLGDMPLPGTRKYTIYILFPRAPGVTTGTPVRKSGISIGRVSNVELLRPPVGGNNVRVTCDIDADRELYESDACRIANEALLGDPVLEFVPPEREFAGARKLIDGNEIQNGVVGGNPLEVLVNLESEMRTALRSIRDAGDEVRRVSGALGNVVQGNNDQIPRIMQKTERALDQFSNTMTTINQTFGDPELREGLKNSLKQVPEIFARANETLKKADDTFAAFKEVGERASKNLDNLEAFTRPLGERGPELVENLDGSLSNVNELLENLVTLTEKFNSEEGTIGKLLADDELYHRLNRTLANVEDISVKIKPIVDDFRIFSDKLARDPRQLGVKGALDRRPLGVGAKQASYGNETIYFAPGYDVHEEVFIPEPMARQPGATQR